MEAAWARGHGLQRSRGHPCLARLVGKSCWVYKMAGIHTPLKEVISCDLPGSDHVSFWLKGGRPAAYVMQPYEVSSESLDGIFEFCKKHKLKVSISTDKSWHNPGKTTLIVIYKPGVMAESA
jgi:hypothetical protein